VAPPGRQSTLAQQPMRLTTPRQTTFQQILPPRRAWRISIIDRYLLREILLTWAAVTLVLLAIMVSHSLGRILVQASEGRIGADVVFPLLGATVVRLLVTLVPLGLYLGILLGLGRLYRDSEMAALTACGVGTRQLYRPVLGSGLLGVLLVSALTVWVSPWAAGLEEKLEREAARRSSLAALSAGTFASSSSGDDVLYARGLSSDRRRLTDIFVHNRLDDGTLAVEVATSAEHQRDAESGDEFLVFVDGQRHEGSPGEPHYRVIEFTRHGLLLPRPPPAGGSTELEAQPTGTLFGSDDPRIIAELQWRLSMPLSTLLLALLAVPLAHTSPRSGRYSRIAVAILVYIPYANLLVVARKAVEAGQVPPALGLWWVHALIVLLVLVLLAQRSGRLRRPRSAAATRPAVSQSAPDSVADPARGADSA